MRNDLGAGRVLAWRTLDKTDVRHHRDHEALPLLLDKADPAQKEILQRWGL